MSDPQNVIVWLDPGLTTGMAWWDPKQKRFGSWQYDAPDLAARLDILSLTYGDRLAVGYEMYVVTSGGVRSAPKHAQEVIGVVRGMAAQEKFRLLPPMPSGVRKLGSVTYLRRLGWYKPGKRHANDAAMHLLSYLMRQKPMNPYVKSKLFPGYTTDVTIASRTSEVQE